MMVTYDGIKELLVNFCGASVLVLSVLISCLSFISEWKMKKHFERLRERMVDEIGDDEYV